MNIFSGEVWYVKFPLEEDPTQFLPRPVIVLNVETARISKTMMLEKSLFDFKIGNLHVDNLINVQNEYMNFISKS